MLRRRRSRQGSAGLRASFTPSMIIGVRRTAEGLEVWPTVYIQARDRSRRLALAGEVMISIWADVSGLVDWIPGIDYRKWAEEQPTGEDGRVRWSAYDYGNKWYRLTARHVDSGATVGLEFRVQDGLVVQEKTQVLLDEAKEMPASFEQPMGLAPYSHIPSVHWTPEGWEVR